MSEIRIDGFGRFDEDGLHLVGLDERVPLAFNRCRGAITTPRLGSFLAMKARDTCNSGRGWSWGVAIVFVGGGGEKMVLHPFHVRQEYESDVSLFPPTLQRVALPPGRRWPTTQWVPSAEVPHGALQVNALWIPVSGKTLHHADLNASWGQFRVLHDIPTTVNLNLPIRRARASADSSHSRLSLSGRRLHL